MLLSKALMLRGGAEAPSKLQLFVQIFMPSYGHNSTEGNIQDMKSHCRCAHAEAVIVNALVIQGSGL
jgi:hypothetical protein